MYQDNSVSDIAKKIGRTVCAVAIRASKLGLRKERYIWSKKELNLLKELYPSRTAQQIAGQIGRSAQATRLKTVKSGLKERRQKIKT